MRNEKIQLYLWLVKTNLIISAFTFGGGYIVVPMIRKYFVFKKRLFQEEDLIDMAAIAQSVPGAIAINLSALAGYQTAGILGAVLSCVCAVLPPLVILAVVSSCYAAFSSNTVIAAILKGMQAAAAALIVDLVVDMTKMVLKKNSFLLTLFIPAAFLANFIFHVNAALILILCCLICGVQVYWKQKKEDSHYGNPR